MSYRPAALAAAACALTCALHAPVVEAQEERFSVRLGYGVTWDDNVFRLPDDAPDPELSRGIAGKSDRFSTASIGLHVNLPLSMQRFLLDATRAAVRYEKFSSRDQDPFTYRGAWQWQLTPRLSGVLSASRSETRVNVEDVQGRRTIDQQTTDRTATADAWLWGGWHLVSSFSDTETKYDQPLFSRPDTTQTAVAAGVRYIARSNSQVTLTQRSTRGTETITDPAILGGSDFTQDDTEVSATWIATGHSTLNARVTKMKRRNELLPQRDFSGTAGELRYTWRPTGRLDINLSAARSVEPFNVSVQSTTRVDQTLGAALTWAISERIALQSNASRRVSRYGQVSTSFEARRDITESISLGARWTPRRYVSLDARIGHEERDSTDAVQVFDSNVASLNLELRF